MGAGDNRFRTEIEVFTFDIDFAGHVSNIVYHRWLEVARVRFLEAIGTPIAAMVDAGVAPIIARTEIDYRRPVRLGDEVEVGLWITELRAASALVRFEVVAGKSRDVAARALQRGLFVNLDTGRPTRVPQAARAGFQPFLDQTD